MGRLRLGDGSVSVTMDDTLDRLVRGAAERVYPGAVDRIEREISEVLDDVRKRWPVGRKRKPARPHSRDRFSMQVRVNGDFTRISGHIVNPVDYVRYVKPKFLGGKSGVVTFIRTPIRRRAKALVKDLAKQIRGDLGRL